MKRLVLLFLAVLISLPCISFAGRSAPPTTPWPMVMNNPQHSGQSPYVGPNIGNLYATIKSGINTHGTGNVLLGQDGTIYKTGSVYYPSTNTYGGILAAFDPTGVMKWRYDFPENSGNGFFPAIGSNGVIYAAPRYTLYAINSLTGELIWQTYLGSTGYQVKMITISSAGTIYVPGSEITAVNPDGSIKWKYYCSDLCSSIALAPQEDKIYTVKVSAGLGILTAIDQNGAELWGLALGDGTGRRFTVEYHNPIAVAGDGTLYTQAVVGSISYLYAITPSGTLKWQFKIVDNTWMGDAWTVLVPAVSTKGNIYFLLGAASSNNTNDARLYALNSRGRLKWYYTIPDQCQSNGPAIDANENIYFASDDGTIYSLTSTGALIWSIAASPYNFWGHYPAIGNDGRLYIDSGYDDNIYIIGQ